MTTARISLAQTRSESRPVLLVLFAATLLYGVLFLGIAVAQEHIENRQRRDIFTLAVALAGIVAAFLSRNSWAKENRLITWAAAGLPCYAVLQMIPLPLGLVGLLSPARAELVRSLEPLFGRQSWRV